jgi:hypothetical protein
LHLGGGAQLGVRGASRECGGGQEHDGEKRLHAAMFAAPCDKPRAPA